MEIAWAKKYLAERAVTPASAEQLDLRADTDQRRICFPVRDFKRRLVGLHGRAVDAHTEPRYRMYLQAGKNNPIVWLGEDWVDLNQPIVVVEGPFDLASVKRVYDNVVSPLFVNPSFAKMKRMTDALEWVTLYDRGAGGDAGRDKVSKLLGHDHVITHLHPPKGRKDPGEMVEAGAGRTIAACRAIDCKNPLTLDRRARIVIRTDQVKQNKQESLSWRLLSQRRNPQVRPQPRGPARQRVPRLTATPRPG